MPTISRFSKFLAEVLSESVADLGYVGPLDRRLRNYLIHTYHAPSPDPAITKDLIEQWIKLRQSGTRQELESDEWHSLERSYREHLKWRFSYPQIVFGQQLVTSWIITILIVLLILSGLAFSFLQLYNALQLGNIQTLTTALALETAGRITISSSIVGAVVLIISLVFFYLYLQHVFGVRMPTPPHVSLMDTDAMKLIEKLEAVRSAKKSPIRRPRKT